MTILSNTQGGVPDGTKDTPAERVYSIIQQVYDGELNPDEAFQQLLDAACHDLTCGDLSHGHGVIKTAWEPPQKDLL